MKPLLLCAAILLISSAAFADYTDNHNEYISGPKDNPQVKNPTWDMSVQLTDNDKHYISCNRLVDTPAQVPYVYCWTLPTWKPIYPLDSVTVKMVEDSTGGGTLQTCYIKNVSFTLISAGTQMHNLYWGGYFDGKNVFHLGCGQYNLEQVHN